MLKPSLAASAVCYFALPSLVACAIATPSTVQTASSSPPWLLHNITVFSARPASPGASYVDFVFKDVRPGLHLTTPCRRVVLPGDGDTLDDAENYYACADSTVGFQFARGSFNLARTYIDSRSDTFSTSSLCAQWHLTWTVSARLEWTSRLPTEGRRQA